jgi:hypothetical protein
MFRTSFRASFLRKERPCNTGRILTRRKMSTSPANKPVELTTDEKAAEIGKEAMPWFQKYAILIVPSVAFCLVSTDIIINPNHRELLEEYLPAYVDFVREKHGFDDEDLVEKTRVNYVQYVHSQPVDLVVKFNNRPDLRISDVDGNQPLSSLQTLIRSRLMGENAGGGSQNEGSGQKFDITNGSYNNDDVDDIYFEDSAAPDLDAVKLLHRHAFRHAKAPLESQSQSPLVYGGGGSSEGGAGFSGADVHPSSESAILKNVKMEGSYNPAALGDPFSNSRWSDYPPTDLKSPIHKYIYSSGNDKSTALGFDMTTLGLRGKESSNSSINTTKTTTPGMGVDRKVLDVPFTNCVKSAVDGLRAYRHCGNQDKMILLRIQPAADNANKQKQGKRGLSSKAASTSSTATALAHQRQMAVEAVSQRKRKIKDLEAEMRGNSRGGREIDAIAADIAQVQSEIGQINRKYLNYFYYF